MFLSVLLFQHCMRVNVKLVRNKFKKNNLEVHMASMQERACKHLRKYGPIFLRACNDNSVKNSTHVNLRYDKIIAALFTNKFSMKTLPRKVKIHKIISKKHLET